MKVIVILKVIVCLRYTNRFVITREDKHVYSENILQNSKTRKMIKIKYLEK